MFDNDLSQLQIKVGQKLFYKVGVKVFDDSASDSSVQLANGISTYMTMTVLDAASLTYGASAMVLGALTAA